MPAVVAAVKDKVSPSESVSLAITSVLLNAASLMTVNISSTATGALLDGEAEIIKALLAPREFVDPGLGKVKTALLDASLAIRLLFNGMTTKPEELSATYA